MEQRQVVKSSSRQVVTGEVPVFSFEQLDLYQAARAFSRRLAKLCTLLPADERYRLKQQIARARLSLTNAIAEGHGRYTFKDRKHFCYEARSSLQELVDDINECHEMGYAKPEHLGDLKRDAFRVLQMIDGWVRYLEKQRRRSDAIASMVKKQKRTKPAQKVSGSHDLTT
jgi:four helix bundle protein